MATFVGWPQTQRAERARSIPIAWSAKWLSLTGIQVAMVAGIAAIVGYLLIVALSLRVDYFDSYMNLLNARSIVTGEGWQYAVERPILYPAVLSPIFFVFERFSGGSLAEFIAAHLLAILALALFLFVSFKLFRLHLNRWWALAGVVMLSWNVILISQAPLAKEDIPGALFTTAAFFFYLRARQTGRWRHFLLAGVMIAAVMGARYQLAPLPFAVIALFEVISLIAARARFPLHPLTVPSFRFRSALRSRVRVVSLPSAVRVKDWIIVGIQAACLFVLPFALLLLIPTLVYPLIHRAPLLGAPAQFIADLRSILHAYSLSGGAPGTRTPAVANYRYLAESLTWPLVLCAALGAVWSVRSRRPGTFFYLLWFVTFFLVQTYFIAHQEARYLIVDLPPLYFFAARGLEAITRLPVVLPRMRLGRELQGGLLVGLLLLVPAGNAVAAGARFTDPVYSTNYEAQVARYASVLAGSQRLSWVGPVYALHPRDYVFDRADPVTYIYHFYAFQMMFWTRQWVYPLYGYRVVSDPGAPAFLYPGIANVLRDGDVVVVNPASQGYATGAMPDSIPPLVVEQVHTQLFASRMLPDPASWSFASPTMPGVISIHQQGAAHLVEGVGLPDGEFEVYTPETTSQLWHSLALVTVRGGAFTTTLPAANWPAGRPLGNLLLLYYGSAFSFPAPGT
jgi:hypothetical protein